MKKLPRWLFTTLEMKRINQGNFTSTPCRECNLAGFVWWDNIVNEPVEKQFQGEQDKYSKEICEDCCGLGFTLNIGEIV